MAKQGKGKGIPARKPRDTFRDVDSLLVRSAESLGRMIGSLQRQLDDVTRQVSTGAERAKALLHLDGHGPSDEQGIPLDASTKTGAKNSAKTGRVRKSTSARAATGKSGGSGSRKTAATKTAAAKPAAKRAATSVATSAVAKKKTALGGSGAKRKTARKASRGA